MGEYFPARHVEQDPELEAENLPGSHSVQLPALTAENVPALHVAHAVESTGA
jgi:hypothetical protein